MAKREDMENKYRDNSRRRSSVLKEDIILQSWKDASGATKGRRRSSIAGIARHISNKLLTNRYARMSSVNLYLGQ